MFGDDGLAIAVGVMTFLILIFGEITPKTYCNANATKIALQVRRRAAWLFSYAFWPVVKMFEMHNAKGDGQADRQQLPRAAHHRGRHPRA